MATGHPAVRHRTVYGRRYLFRRIQAGFLLAYLLAH